MSTESASTTPAELGSSIYSKELNIECRIHRCPQTLYTTFKLIFPDLAAVMPSRAKLASGEASFDLNIVTVWQQTANDMSGFSDKTQMERDEKTGKVRSFRPPTSIATALYRELL